MITIFFIAYLQATRKQQQHGQHSLVRVPAPAAAVVVAIVV